MARAWWRHGARRVGVRGCSRLAALPGLDDTRRQRTGMLGRRDGQGLAHGLHLSFNAVGQGEGDRRSAPIDAGEIVDESVDELEAGSQHGVG